MSDKYRNKVVKTLLKSAKDRFIPTKKSIKPVILEFMITSHCNCKCLMCNIWQKNGKEDLSLSEIERLLDDPVLSELRTITLTGGDPFCREDILDICKLISSKSKNLIQLYISTNGFLEDHIYKQLMSIKELMPSILRLRIGISFDHIGSEHDRIRGKKGIHQNALSLAKRISLLDDDRISVQGNFTIAPHNVTDLKNIYKYFSDKQLKMFWFPIMVSDNFYENTEQGSKLVFNPDEQRKLVEFVRFIHSQGHSLNDDYYYSGLLRTLEKGTRSFPCTGGTKFLHINNRGDVFPCYIIPKSYKYGNIRERSLNEIWYSETAHKIRQKIGSCETCKSCIQWYDGYAGSYNPFYFTAFLLSRTVRTLQKLRQ